MGNEIFLKVGAMEPQCLLTNLALYIPNTHDKKKIIIIKAPDGPGIPEKIRKGWIGAILEPVDGPFTAGTKPIFEDEPHKWTEGYAVSSIVALEALKKTSLKSWDWFMQRNISETFFFNKDCCKIIQ